MIAAPSRLVVAAGTVTSSSQPDGAVRVIRLALRFPVLERMHLAGDCQSDVTRLGSFLVDGPAQSFHGFRVGSGQQGDAIDVEQLVVGAEAAVSRSGPAMQDGLDEDAEIGGGPRRRRRLPLDGNAESSFFRVVDGNVQREDFALLPRQK